MMRRAVQALVAGTLALGLVPIGTQVSEAASPAWPQFVQAHIAARRADTRVIVDAGHAGARWASQPGVRPGDYLFRVDQSGLVRSLDGKLAMTRQGPAANGNLTVHVQSPGVDGADVFVLDPTARPAPVTAETHAGPDGNRVSGVFPPTRPQTNLPLELEINVSGICRTNQYLQVAMEWTNTVWRTPDGTSPGLYRVRVNADLTVQSLDGKTTFTQVPAAAQDHGRQIFAALIVHSCDPQGDGADIIGWDRDPASGALLKQTSFDQVLDTGYGWQVFNTANTSARESLFGGNYIVLADPHPPAPPPLNLSPIRLNAGSYPGVSVVASQAHWQSGSATAAVLARVDQFADALAGIPLALRKGGPLLLTPPSALDGSVTAELRRVLQPGAPVYLLGGVQALSEAVEAAVRDAGYQPNRLAGADRVGTAVAVANAIGPAANAFVVNAWNFPDALAAGSAAGAVEGGAHILLTNPDNVPAATAARLSAGAYTRRFVFGGPVVVQDPTAAAIGADERISGADRDHTASAAATRFLPGASTVWLADGGDFVGGITGGAMAARLRGPLLLATGKVGDPVRGYLTGRPVAAAYVMAGLDEGISRLVFTQPSRAV